MTSIARQVANTINGHNYSAYSLQAGYLVLNPFSGGGTVHFPTGTMIRETRDKLTQRVKTSVIEYTDGSRITYHFEKGLKIYEKAK